METLRSVLLTRAVEIPNKTRGYVQFFNTILFTIMKWFYNFLVSVQYNCDCFAMPMINVVVPPTRKCLLKYFNIYKVYIMC